MNGKSNIADQEVPKYLKQKESNTSKANKKSKHKHHYEECLIQYRQNYNFLNKEDKDKIHSLLDSYCTICGKTGGYLKNGNCRKEVEELQKERQNGKSYWVGISGDEIYERYHDKLPVFFVEDIYKDKYVNLEEKN